MIGFPCPRRPAVLAAFVAALLGCGPADRTAPPEATGARSYEVRGIVESLPGPAGGGGELLVRHEAIPGLVGPGGEIEGMEAMTMPFPVAEGLDLSGIAAGDRIRFTVRVEWEATRPVVVTELDRLPADTELELD